MHRTIIRKISLTTTLLILGLYCFAIAGDKNGAAPPAAPEKAPAVTNDKKEAGADKTDPATKAIGSKRRDPFFSPAKYVPPPPPPVKITKQGKPAPQPVPVPSIETRVENYKAMMREYLAGRGKEPSKLSAYTIEELTLTGIFRTDDGDGAFVVETASRNQQTYFAKSGWQTFDGYIKEILPTGVRFVKNTRYDNGSVQQAEVFRPLPTQTTK